MAPARLGCVVLGALGWPLGGYRLSSLLAFFGLLVGLGAYWYGDRVVLGMLGARELPLAEAPVVHASVARLATLSGVPKPRVYLLPDGLPRALVAGRGLRGSRDRRQQRAARRRASGRARGRARARAVAHPQP